MTSLPSFRYFSQAIYRGRVVPSLVMPRPQNTRCVHMRTLVPISLKTAPLTAAKPLTQLSVFSQQSSLFNIASINYKPRLLHTNMSEGETTTAPSAGLPGQPKITLHWLNQSRAQRIVWLLEELGLEYDIKYHQRTPSMVAPEESKEIHPLGKFPIVVVGDKVLAESGFIIEYLIDRFGPQLKPTDEDSLLRYKYFLHYAEGSLMPPMLVGLIIENINKAPVPFFVKPLIKMVTGGVATRFLAPNYKTHFTFLESELSSRPWLAGEEFSGVDILLSFQLVAAKWLGGLKKEDYPKLFEYMEKYEARDAYKRATKKTEEMEAAGLKL